jgi:hypothetical protein
MRDKAPLELQGVEIPEQAARYGAKNIRVLVRGKSADDFWVGTQGE